MLLTKTVKVKWNEKTRKHYEDLGYKYTKTGDEFEVKVEDLTKGCNAIISYNCDNCGEVKECMYKDYVKIKKINGYNYYCNKCRHNHRSNSKKEKDTKKIKKSSLYDWCVKNDRLDVLERWDYELNDCSPKDISWCSNDRYYFKCDKHINHHSELKSIWGSITQRNGKIICSQCNSIAQYILDNFPNKKLEEVWDFDKNGDLDPWEIRKGSKKIWIKCLKNNYHGSYLTSPNRFAGGHRCPYCSGRYTKPKDSLGQYIIDNYGEEFLWKIWSDKNEKTPFEYSVGSNRKVWWKSIDNTCEDFERKIYSSVKYNFGNPKVVNRLKPNYETTLTEEQIIKGFNIGDNYRAYVKDCISKTLGYYKRECTGIYKIENSINGKVYIGQAKNIEDRWVEHVYSSLSKSAEEYNYPLYHAFRKYGIGNFNFDIIEECKIEEMDEREIYYIKQYNSNIHNKNSHGYNQTDGGNAIRGWKMSEERKQRQRDIIQEKRKNGVYDCFNKIVVCEDKEFISAKNCAEYYGVNYNTMNGWLTHNNDMPKKWYDKGLRYKNEPMSNYKLSEVEIRRVICEGITYDNITECAKYYGVKSRLLSQYLNKSINMSKEWYDRGLHFEGTTMDDYKLSTKNKMVICDNIIFNTIKECANYYNINPPTMQYWLKGKNPMPQEFKDKGLKYYKKG